LPEYELATCDGVGLLMLALRVALGGMFLWSAVAKLRSPDAGSELISFLGLPRWLGRPMSLLPRLEALLGLALIGGVSEASVAASVVLAVFLAALGFAAARGYRGGCGCFGDSRTDSGLIPLGRTGLLFAAATFLATTPGIASCASQPLWVTPVGTSLAVGLLAIGALCLYGMVALIAGLRAVDHRQEG